VFGDPEGDLLVVGWGSTKGVIEEAVERLRDEGLKVSSLHLTFIQPLPSGIRDILRRFKRVMTVEGNWADRLDDELVDADNRRYAALAMMLRSRYLVDVNCWTQSRGQPMKPGAVAEALRAKLAEPVAENVAP
jgi:2-oxoglutarate ferredoxin oxidoreductase subunit alpha